MFAPAGFDTRIFTIDPESMFYTRPIIEDNVSPAVIAQWYKPLLILTKDVEVISVWSW
jgi:hypothetical protein